MPLQRGTHLTEVGGSFMLSQEAGELPEMDAATPEGSLDSTAMTGGSVTPLE
jgi:hypothetical protein